MKRATPKNTERLAVKTTNIENALNVLTEELTDLCLRNWKGGEGNLMRCAREARDAMRTATTATSKAADACMNLRHEARKRGTQ